MKRKRIIANFFGMYLIKEYCENAYCSNCKLSFPISLCCFRCQTFESITFPLSVTCISDKTSKYEFTSTQDASTWEYVFKNTTIKIRGSITNITSQTNTKNAFPSFFLRSRFPCKTLNYKLRLNVQRKRTRNSIDEYTLRLISRIDDDDLNTLLEF